MMKRLRKTSPTAPKGKPLQKKGGTSPTTGKVVKPLRKQEKAASGNGNSGSGKPLRQKSTVPEVVFKQPNEPVLPTVGKGFKWKKGPVAPKSQRDEVKRFYRIKPENMPDVFPKLHESVPPNTEFIVNVQTGTMDALYTTLPSKVTMVWNNCARCNAWAPMCQCSTGIVAPRSIEHSYIVDQAIKEGDEVHGLSQGKVDATQIAITSRGRYWYAPKKPTPSFAAPSFRPVSRPAKPLAGSSTPTKAEKPANGSLAPSGRRLRKADKPAAPEVDVANLNMAELNRDAKARSDSSVEAVKKALAGKPVAKKPLKKTGTKPVKPLRKREK